MEYGPLKAYCPVCGKFFVTMWREHWIHRRGETYYCSNDCLMVDLTRDTKMMNEAIRRSINRKGLTKMNGKITLEMKKRAVDMAISGDSPIPYLMECGAKNPSATWLYIKKCLEKADPEKFAQLPERLNRAAGDNQSSLTIEAAKIEIPEEKTISMEMPEKIVCTPEDFIGYKVRAIECEYGQFYFCTNRNTMYWTTAEGEEVALTPTGWRILAKKLPQIMELLGAVK